MSPSIQCITMKMYEGGKTTGPDAEILQKEKGVGKFATENCMIIFVFKKN